jgi:hypothetical protein
MVTVGAYGSDRDREQLGSMRRVGMSSCGVQDVD